MSGNERKDKDRKGETDQPLEVTDRNLYKTYCSTSEQKKEKEREVRSNRRLKTIEVAKEEGKERKERRGGGLLSGVDSEGII